MAAGLISAEEHRRRLDVVYAASNRGEILPAVEDLPELVPTDVARPGPKILRVFGAGRRKGRWLVEPRTRVINVYGGTVLDLGEALLAAPTVEIKVICVFGVVLLRVPEGVRVEKRGFGVFGVVYVPSDLQAAPAHDAPVVRLRGLASWGLVIAKRSARKRAR